MCHTPRVRRLPSLTLVALLLLSPTRGRAEVPAGAPVIAQPEKLPRPPVRPGEAAYVSRGVRSKFSFGFGVHVGVNSLKAKVPLLAGVSAHFRMSGIAGLTAEFDFNRVATTPAAADLRIEALHFIPNFRVAAVIHPYRWRMLGPYLFGGVGLDTASTSDRANILIGAGLEVTFWKDRLAVLGEFRAFLPRPSDVEKHKQRVSISGSTATASDWDYYNTKNLLFTLSLRFYY
jgi:hypothetical protein